MLARYRKQCAFLLVGAIFLGACQSGKTGQGGAIGAAAGGILGGVIGNQKDHTVIGAILGAVVGGAAGAYIGNYMDRQADEIREDIEGATVERVGEGIKITFDSGLLFDVGEDALLGPTRENLKELAGILQKYENTNILIEGHTDATGSDALNLRLSERRAESVSYFLAQLNVDAARMTTRGYGESQPVASNDTADGRALNRRVDLAIMADDELKEIAREQTE